MGGGAWDSSDKVVRIAAVRELLYIAHAICKSCEAFRAHDEKGIWHSIPHLTLQPFSLARNGVYYLLYDQVCRLVPASQM